MTRLSPHFTTEEFRCRDGTPLPIHARPAARELANEYLEQLRERFGVCRIISGYRSPSHNRRVGGAPASYHVAVRGRWGIAADVIFARGDPEAWARAAAQLDPGGLGVYRDHVHVDNRRGHARWTG